MKNRICIGLASLAVPMSLLAAQSKTQLRSLAWIPRDAIVLLGVRPQELKDNELVGEMFDRSSETQLPILGIRLADVREADLAILPAQHNGFPFVLKFKLTDAGLLTLSQEFQRRYRTVSLGSYPVFESNRGRQDPAVYVAENNQVVVASDTRTLARALQGESAESTRWAPKWQASEAPVILVGNGELLRGQDLRFLWYSYRSMRDVYQAPNRSWQFLECTRDFVLELSGSDVLELQLRAESLDEQDAKSAWQGTNSLVSYARTLLSQLRNSDVVADTNGAFFPLIDSVDQSLEKAEFEYSKNRLEGTVTLEDPRGMIKKTLARTASAAFAAQRRRARVDSLKRIALAISNYESAYRRVPMATQPGPKETPHSWRVTVLPYIGGLDVYRAYKQEEPWDSEHNSQFRAQIPEVLQGDSGKRGETDIQVFHGKGAAFDPSGPLRYGSYPDLLSNTLMAAITPDSVPWTKPQDIEVDPDKPLPGWMHDGFTAALMDGSIVEIPKGIGEKALRALISRAGGEPPVELDPLRQR